MVSSWSWLPQIPAVWGRHAPQPAVATFGLIWAALITALPASPGAQAADYPTFLSQIGATCQLPNLPNAPAFQGNTPAIWGYQLQNDSAQTIASSPYDVIVTDYSKDGTAANKFTPEEVAIMKVKPDGGRRLVIAYVSIGEAEQGRWYWRSSWDSNPPSYIGAVNPDWVGNFAVQYWTKSWQDIIINKSNSYIQQVVKAGFDGVYLDKVDEYVYKATVNNEAPDQYGNVNVRGRYANRMVSFVKNIATTAKALNPNFLIIAQNAEDLLDRDDYRALVDGNGKESLLYHANGTVLSDGTYSSDYATGVENAPDDVCSSATLLRNLQADGKPVLVVEYLTQADKKQLASDALTSVMLVPTFQPQDLGHLVLPDQVPTLGGGPRSLTASVTAKRSAAAAQVNLCLNATEIDCRLNAACVWLTSYRVSGKEIPGYCRTKPLAALQFRSQAPGAVAGPSVGVTPKTK